MLHELADACKSLPQLKERTLRNIVLASSVALLNSSCSLTSVLQHDARTSINATSKVTAEQKELANFKSILGQYIGPNDSLLWNNLDDLYMRQPSEINRTFELKYDYAPDDKIDSPIKDRIMGTRNYLLRLPSDNPFNTGDINIFVALDYMGRDKKRVVNFFWNQYGQAIPYGTWYPNNDRITSAEDRVALARKSLAFQPEIYYQDSSHLDVVTGDYSESGTDYLRTDHVILNRSLSVEIRTSFDYPDHQD